MTSLAARLGGEVALLTGQRVTAVEQVLLFLLLLLLILPLLLLTLLLILLQGQSGVSVTTQQGRILHCRALVLTIPPRCLPPTLGTPSTPPQPAEPALLAAHPPQVEGLGTETVGAGGPAPLEGYLLYQVGETVGKRTSVHL